MKSRWNPDEIQMKSSLFMVCLHLSVILIPSSRFELGIFLLVWHPSWSEIAPNVPGCFHQKFAQILETAGNCFRSTIFRKFLMRWVINGRKSVWNSHLGFHPKFPLISIPCKWVISSGQPNRQKAKWIHIYGPITFDTSDPFTDQNYHQSEASSSWNPQTWIQIHG